MAHTGTPTKTFVDIADIRDIVVVLKNGSLRSVVEVTSINFGLKSPDEQQAVIQGFQNFLNALDFPAQIVISSRRLDITGYISSLSDVEQKLTNELLKVQLREYGKFIGELSTMGGIMAKKFYIVVPYYATEATFGAKEGFFKKITSVFSPSSFVKRMSDEDIERYKFQLGQRISLVEGGLGGMGIKTHVLERDELFAMYNDYYNPPAPFVSSSKQ